MTSKNDLKVGQNWKKVQHFMNNDLMQITDEDKKKLESINLDKAKLSQAGALALNTTKTLQETARLSVNN